MNAGWMDKSQSAKSLYFQKPSATKYVVRFGDRVGLP